MPPGGGPIGVTVVRCHSWCAALAATARIIKNHEMVKFHEVVWGETQL